ncbi:MAG: 50S ribosome-binding GTPase [Candidatus Lokiarchaeota archaeon]|nr:50S ribosome-binding GTPase [Candidatus Lokiarchaeota archaeon]
MSNKISIVGRAGVGKTSIIKLIFEGYDPKDLMMKPLEPTRGINPKGYYWMDLELGVFDTSGQELPYLLEDEQEQLIAFENANIVIYIFDYPRWTSNSQEIINEIHTIYNSLKDISGKIKLALIFHKVDLINQKIKGNYFLMRNGIKNRINLPENIPIYFTSLYPESVHSTFNAFSNILSNFSIESRKLRDILNHNISTFPRTISFITKKDNSVLVQSIGSEFNTSNIRNLYVLTAHYRNLTSSVDIFDGKIHYVDSGPQVLSFVIENLQEYNPNLNALMVFSEDHDSEELSELTTKIKVDIKNIYVQH